MSALSTPWIVAYLLECGKTYGSDPIPSTDRPRTVQIIKYITGPTAAEPDPRIYWAEVSDGVHHLPAKLSEKVVAGFAETRGYRISKYKTGYFVINKYRPFVTNVPTGRSDEQVEAAARLALDIDNLELLGSEEEPPVGSPIPAGSDSQLRLWVSGLARGGRGGDVLKDESERQKNFLSKTNRMDGTGGPQMIPIVSKPKLSEPRPSEEPTFKDWHEFLGPLCDKTTNKCNSAGYFFIDDIRPPAETELALNSLIKYPTTQANLPLPRSLAPEETLLTPQTISPETGPCMESDLYPDTLTRHPTSASLSAHLSLNRSSQAGQASSVMAPSREESPELILTQSWIPTQPQPILDEEQKHQITVTNGDGMVHDQDTKIVASQPLPLVAESNPSIPPSRGSVQLLKSNQEPEDISLEACTSQRSKDDSSFGKVLVLNSDTSQPVSYSQDSFSLSQPEFGKASRQIINSENWLKSPTQSSVTSFHVPELNEAAILQNQCEMEDVDRRSPPKEEGAELGEINRNEISLPREVKQTVLTGLDKSRSLMPNHQCCDLPIPVVHVTTSAGHSNEVQGTELISDVSGRDDATPVMNLGLHHSSDSVEKPHKDEAPIIAAQQSPLRRSRSPLEGPISKRQRLEAPLVERVAHNPKAWVQASFLTRRHAKRQDHQRVKKPTRQHESDSDQDSPAGVASTSIEGSKRNGSSSLTVKNRPHRTGEDGLPTLKSETEPENPGRAQPHDNLWIEESVSGLKRVSESRESLSHMKQEPPQVTWGQLGRMLRTLERIHRPP